ncbi:MAG: sugar phosphate isomerase/epimerase [Anaerolineae bacterium]|nr:sugar phosphate isomerase/epimerase [Anaerolineae bacterium]
MRLTVSSYSFEAIPLDGALAVVKSMGFNETDIGGFHQRGRASLEPEEVAAQPQKMADDLRRLLDKHQLRACDYFVQFGTSPGHRALTDLDPAVPAKNIKTMEGIAKFVKALGLHNVTVLPGVDEPSRPLEQNLDLAGAGLKRYVEICGEQGAQVSFEPHMGSVADTPELALAIVERAPGVKFAVDYSHFVLQYIPVERIHKLLPHAGHVHIRPARPGKLQTRWAENQIDFVDMIKRLQALNYQGCASIEYVCSDWFDVNQVDTLNETMVTKEALLPYISV